MIFDLTVFRNRYPRFASVADDVVMASADQAKCYLGDFPCADDCAVYLIVAHLLHLASNIDNGIPAGQITSSTIDKVSVTIVQAPGANNSYVYWLNSTPYGQQLAAILARCAAGGVYVGGMPERAAFRSVGGVFPRWGKVWPR